MSARRRAAHVRSRPKADSANALAEASKKDLRFETASHSSHSPRGGFRQLRAEPVRDDLPPKNQGYLMRGSSFLVLGALLIASPAFAQQSAWELYRAEFPSRAAGVEEGLGYDTWREEENRPIDGSLSLSTVSWGYETGEVRVWAALMNSGSTPLCVEPDIVTRGSFTVLLQDEEMALLPPYSSRLIFKSEGWREQLGSFNLYLPDGAPSASGRCSGHSAAVPTPSESGALVPVAAVPTHDWVVAGSTNRLRIGFDQSGISESGIRLVRTVTAHRIPRVSITDDEVVYDYQLMLYKIDCSEMQWSNISIENYLLGSALPVQNFTSGEDQWQKPPRESIAEVLIQKVCDSRPERSNYITTPQEFVRQAREELNG